VSAEKSAVTGGGVKQQRTRAVRGINDGYPTLANAFQNSPFPLVHSRPAFVDDRAESNDGAQLQLYRDGFKVVRVNGMN
jgi:hypothetical protein